MRSFPTTFEGPKLLQIVLRVAILIIIKEAKDVERSLLGFPMVFHVSMFFNLYPGIPNVTQSFLLRSQKAGAPIFQGQNLLAVSSKSFVEGMGFGEVAKSGSIKSSAWFTLPLIIMEVENIPFGD